MGPICPWTLEYKIPTKAVASENSSQVVTAYVTLPRGHHIHSLLALRVREGTGIRTEKSRFWSWSHHLSRCVTLGKSLLSPGPQFPPLVMGQFSPRTQTVPVP